MTGFAAFEYRMSGKWLELLIQSVAPALGVELRPLGVRDAGEIERAIAAFARSPNDGLIVTPSAPTLVHGALIVALRRGTSYRQSTTTNILSPLAALSPMALTESTRTGGRLTTSIAFSKERNRPTCRCKRPPNMN